MISSSKVLDYPSCLLYLQCQTPRFRVDEADKCNPGITSVFGEDIYWRRDLTTYPNPVSTQLNIELPEGERGKVYIFDMEGRLILEDDKVYSSAAVSLDMSGIPAGTILWSSCQRIIRSGGCGRLGWL